MKLWIKKCSDWVVLWRLAEKVTLKYAAQEKISVFLASSLTAEKSLHREPRPGTELLPEITFYVRKTSVLLICSWCQLHCCSHCSLNPGKARSELRGWKKTRGAVGTADMFILSGQQSWHKLTRHNLSPGWHSGPNSLLSWLTQQS